MIVLLTSTMLVRVDEVEEAGEIAAIMTNTIEAGLNDVWEKQGISTEEGRQIVFPLGVLVQAVPDDVAT